MKILLMRDIYNSLLGNSKLPIVDLLTKIPYPYNRMGETIDYVEKHCVIKATENGLSDEDVYNKAKKLKGEIMQFKNGMYGICTSNPDNLYLFSIVDVDISRPWIITNYDGEDCIEYLDYTIVDKAINYCQKGGM